MRKSIPVILLILFTAPARAALLETLTLDMNANNGLTGITSNTVLSSGTNYEITVSGTFEIGCLAPSGNPPCPTDADYFVPSTTGVPSSFASNGTDIGVQIDNVKIDWGPFATSRVYSTVMMGLDSTIFINYLDTFYADNRGALTVEISSLSEVPIPAAMPLFLTALAALGLIRRRGASGTN